jgi:hypothetical protein
LGILFAGNLPSPSILARIPLNQPVRINVIQPIAAAPKEGLLFAALEAGVAVVGVKV